MAGLAGFEGRVTIPMRVPPTFTPMLDSGGQWVDSILRPKVSRVYIFTKQSMVSPNICDDKRGFAKYL